MNWKKIKNEYPKAWKLFYSNDFIILEEEDLGEKIDVIYLTPYEIEYNIRDLYDFFDQQGISINMHNDSCKIDLEVWDFEQNKYYFMFCIDSLVYWRNDWEHKTFDSRISAEEDAFTKAFEILEDRLSQEYIGSPSSIELKTVEVDKVDLDIINFY